MKRSQTHQATGSHQNWSSHLGSDREHAPAAHRTLRISVEINTPVFHTNKIGGRKRERFLGKPLRNMYGLMRSRSA